MKQIRRAIAFPLVVVSTAITLLAILLTTVALVVEGPQ